MFLSWRGWGIWVFFLFLFWLTAVIIVALSFDSGPETDMIKLNSEMDLGVALILVLTALSVFGLDRYRKNHPRNIVDPASQNIVLAPHVDEFLYLKMGIWPLILLAFALIFGGMSIFGYSPFK